MKYDTECDRLDTDTECHPYHQCSAFYFKRTCGECSQVTGKDKSNDIRSAGKYVAVFRKGLGLNVENISRRIRRDAE